MLIPFLPLKLNPENSSNSLTISYNYPYASSRIIEESVTSKLEAGLSTLEGLKKITSESKKGNGIIILEFDEFLNIEKVRLEASMIIRMIYKKIPKQCTYPTLSLNKSNSQNKAFLSYTIKANKDPYTIKQIILKEIKPNISSIKGIDNIKIYGANSKEYLLTFNDYELKKYNLKKSHILEIIKNNFNRESLGKIFYKNGQVSIELNSNDSDFNWSIPIVKIKNRILFLKDLVSIKLKDKEVSEYYRINGENTIILNLFSEKSINTIKLAKNIENCVFEIKKKLPKEYSIIKTYDSTEYLKNELNKIYTRTFITLFILLIFVFLITKSIRYIFVIIIILTANIGISFLLYYLFQVEIQLYSLAGIAISIGLILDNSIILIEHIKNQQNKSILRVILASTLTTIGSLSVVYFMEETYRANLIDFCLIIILNLLVSLFVAIFFIPPLLSKFQLIFKDDKSWIKKIKQKFYNFYFKIIVFGLKFKKISILILILIFGLPFFKLPQKIEGNENWFLNTYNQIFGNESFNNEIRPYLDKSLGGTLRLFNEYVFENSYNSKNEETRLFIFSSMKNGTTVHQMNSVFLEFEEFLEGFKEIKQYTTQIYSSENASIEIVFKNNLSNNSFPYILKSLLIKKSLDYGGMDWNIYGIGNGFNNKSGTIEPVNFTLKAKGYNYNELNIWANQFKLELEKHPRIKKVAIKDNKNHYNFPLDEFIFSFKQEELALSNLSPNNIVDELNGIMPSKNTDLNVIINGIQIDIHVSSVKSNLNEKKDIWFIQNTPLDSIKKPRKIKNIINISKKNGEESIFKENQEYIRLIEFQYLGSYKSGSIYLNKKLDEFKSKTPLGYKFQRNDNFNILSQDQDDFIFLITLVISIIYIVCTVLFENFKQSFIILSLIPISFIGVFLSFYFFKFNFDNGGFVSFVLLSGITVNASILIIDDFNKMKKKFPDKNYIYVYIESFKRKIFSILLTIFSTILGFIPFVIYGQNEAFWFALGIGTISGLIFSLFGILFFLPIFTLKKQIKEL